MSGAIYSLIPKERLTDILSTLQAYTGISIQLIDDAGILLASFGTVTSYCALLKKQVFERTECFELHRKAGQRAQKIGEAYIFSCHANLNHIAFPLINRDQLLGSVIIGPFLMDKPDSTLVSDLAEKHRLTPTLSLELYDELLGVKVISPARVQQLKKLVDHLLSPLMSSERSLLMKSQEKAYQQAQINETIQTYKGQKATPSFLYFNQKEKELLAKVRTGNVKEVKALLNEIIGYTLFSEGGKIESVRIRAVELTTLLSRVAVDGGARADSIYELNNQFLVQLYKDQEIEELCLHLQDVLEGFMGAMFYEKDKGNPYIRKALRYIADHYSEHLTLERVAEEVQLSPSYFSTLFRQIVGTSFREYLCKIRVEESKRLLLSTDYSLADIAISMGFPDQSYFCKVFKQLVGITPGKFRN